MRKFFAALVILSTLFPMQKTSAFEIYGIMVLLPIKALTSVTSTSSKLAILEHQLTVKSRIFEEGNLQEETTVSCAKQADDDGFPLDLSCNSRAEDLTPTVGCEYCPEGTSEAFTFVLISLGSKDWEDPCRIFNSRPR